MRFGSLAQCGWQGRDFSGGGMGALARLVGGEVAGNAMTEVAMAEMGLVGGWSGLAGWGGAGRLGSPGSGAALDGWFGGIGGMVWSCGTV
ncbi:hypothetical protein TIFTF001_049807 [Ficus carica]|uniref:Uncharacterized protein n=1 Tax=Ficus carica TaxID=3494 RepID=A0AA88CWQ7_FICCA|nr:hypothetical protein TIFTF001_049807 [Ficus carica]